MTAPEERDGFDQLEMDLIETFSEVTRGRLVTVALEIVAVMATIFILAAYLK